MNTNLRHTPARRIVGRIVTAALVAGLLASCASLPTRTAGTINSAATAAPTATANSVAPTATTAPTEAPAATAIPIAPPTATTAPAASTAPDAAVTAALKAVVEQTNQEQIAALAANNPVLMQDTATAAYYQQSAQALSAMLVGGVTKIELLNLTWGQISLTSPTEAQVQTTESWRTTFSNGAVMEESDPNVYTLVLENGAWKVQDDQHPTSPAAQPAAGASSTTTPAAAPVTSADTSRNWAGYTASGGNYTAVSGTWIVPTVQAGTTPAVDATWVGIGGLNTSDLIQAGTQAEAVNGQVEYSAWIELLPQDSHPIPLTVAAGDTVSVTIAEQQAGNWLITVTDATNNQRYQQAVQYQSSLDSAEWIEEAPASARGILPLDNFGAVTFTNATAVQNGTTVSVAQANSQPVAMSNGAGRALAVPSTLNGDGSSFTVTRTSAASTSSSFHTR
jgi:hypothetical protein